MSFMSTRGSEFVLFSIKIPYFARYSIYVIMNFQDIIEDIKAKRYKPIYFLHGEESYFIDQIVDALENNVLEESQKAFNQTILYGKETDVGTILDSAQRYPMMAEHQLIIVKEAQYLSDINNLTEYVKNPVPSTIIALVYKNKKLDGRTGFAKALKKSALVYEAKKLYDNQLPAWIKSYVRSLNMSIGDEEAYILAEFLGTDLSKVVNELQKLRLNLEKGATITKDDIEENIGLSKDYNVFELQDALVQRNPEKAFRIIQYFGGDLKKHSIIMVIAVLGSYFSKLYALRGAGIAHNAQATELIGYYPPFIMKKHIAASRSYSPEQLATIIEILHAYDLQSKGVGVRSVTEYDLMRQLVSDILSIRKPDFEAIYEAV